MSIESELVSKQIDDNEDAFFEQEVDLTELINWAAPYHIDKENFEKMSMRYLEEKIAAEKVEQNNRAFEHIRANQGTCGQRNCIYCDIYRSAMMEIDGSR